MPGPSPATRTDSTFDRRILQIRPHGTRGARAGTRSTGEGAGRHADPHRAGAARGRLATPPRAARGRLGHRHPHPRLPREAEHVVVGGDAPAGRPRRPRPLRRPHPRPRGQGRGPGLLRRRRPRHARGPGDRALAGREGAQLLRGHPLGARALPGLPRAAAADRLPPSRGTASASASSSPSCATSGWRPTTPSSPCPRPRWACPSTPAATSAWPTRSAPATPSCSRSPAGASTRPTAERLGIVQQVTTRDELVPTAMAIAAEIAANAPLAVQSIKRTIDAFAYRGLPEALKFEAIERVGRVRLRRHAGRLRRQGQEAAGRIRGQVAAMGLPEPPPAGSPFLPAGTFDGHDGDRDRRGHRPRAGHRRRAGPRRGGHRHHLALRGAPAGRAWPRSRRSAAGPRTPAADIREPEQIAEAFDALEAALGPADGPRQQRGGQLPGARPPSMRPNAFRSVTNIVLDGTFFCSQELRRRVTGAGRARRGDRQHPGHPVLHRRARAWPTPRRPRRAWAT